ncbi:hypothetical protein JKA74_00520 [Marivirga sp. S37H4]|uniref:Outer membrane protein beta-barrel domain-containing protein n=1 Tax=Marivirga aurantiaca TaxID=2802615 RepID=A0A935C4X3_9BACT|nr:hypothetical protein [Marivirga aurantiaca]MBK6263500.1 hypothetical protein [Marivirga aurantiaca]
MKLILPLIIFLSMASVAVKAQSKFYVAAEANFIQNLYLISDEGDALGPPDFRTIDVPGTSLLVGYQLSPIFSLETGVATRPVKNGYSLTLSGSYQSDLFYQVPIRSRARINILGDWLYVTGNMGIQLGVTDPGNVGVSMDSGVGLGGSSNNGQVIYSTETHYSSVGKYYTVAEGGAGFDFQINGRFKMYTNVSYVRGFSKLCQVDVTYQYANEPEYKGSVVHEGSYLSFSYGLRYHFKSSKEQG